MQAHEQDVDAIYYTIKPAMLYELVPKNNYIKLCAHAPVMRDLDKYETGCSWGSRYVVSSWIVSLQHRLRPLIGMQESGLGFIPPQG